MCRPASKFESRFTRDIDPPSLKDRIPTLLLPLDAAAPGEQATAAPEFTMQYKRRRARARVEIRQAARAFPHAEGGVTGKGSWDDKQPLPRGPSPSPSAGPDTPRSQPH